jgi:hypothetical protein
MGMKRRTRSRACNQGHRYARNHVATTLWLSRLNGIEYAPYLERLPMKRHARFTVVAAVGIPSVCFWLVFSIGQFLTVASGTAAAQDSPPKSGASSSGSAKQDQTESQTKGTATVVISLVSLFIAIISITIALFTFWRSHLSPYNISISPPAITQVNDTIISLMVDFSFYNSGARPAIISDVMVRTFCNSDLLSIVLQAQGMVDRFAEAGNLQFEKGKTKMAVFVPIVMKGGETKAKRVYLATFLNTTPWPYAELLRINRIEFDFQVNNEWRRAIFRLGYDGFKEKFKEDNRIHVPEGGYTPIWYRANMPERVKGHIMRS